MSTFTLEITPSSELTALIEKLLGAFSPRSASAPNMQAQSPEELAARARMSPPSTVAAAPPTYPPTPIPQPPVYAQPPMPLQQFRPGPGAQGYPANPQMPAPMQNNPMMGAGNMAPVAGPAPLQPVPIAPSINPTISGPSTSQPGAYPSNPAPTGAAPAYELDQLARATATLADAGKIDLINQLFQQFQIQRMDQLPKERYGEFATALRGLGARI